MKKIIIPALVLLFVLAGFWIWYPFTEPPSPAGRQWREYLGGPGRNHYSSLKQVTPSNVNKLEVAWEYHTADSGEIQCNPIIVNDTLYGMSASAQPFAINAATGQEYWQKKPEEPGKSGVSRGLVYWESGADKRILYTNGEWLYALDARSGSSIAAFGENGRVSLKAGLGETARNKAVVSTTPGTVYGDLIIMPLRLSEGADAALGRVQAFNIKTGELAWVFHTIPRPGQAGYDTWPQEAYKNKGVGGANNWAGMAVDRERGIVYVPTGSAAPDFYGGNRKGSNLFANCLLALRAETGELLWHFQLVHHDILDRDPPAPPNLITVMREGKPVDAVAQVTKQGYVFVFNRETGEPLFPVKEVPVPASDIPLEKAWPTQPVPSRPAPFARQTFSENDISPYAENKDELLEVFRKSRSEGPFTPLSRQGTIIFPGLDGGAEWGGAAADPEGILYVNSNEMPWHISLGSSATEEELASLSPGERMYVLNCRSCHGAGLNGNPDSGFPSLLNLAGRLNRKEAAGIIRNGKGMMPAFPKLSESERQSLVAFLFQQDKAAAPPQPGNGNGDDNGKGKGKTTRGQGKRTTASAKSPYQISGYTKFLDNKGYPAISPPWGTLNAIDLNTGEYKWKIPYGTHPELTAKGIPPTGTESYGGPVVTASGLLFIAGTKDAKFRAYDKNNGKLLWETQLPAAAFATPSTYEVNGRQYIVLACGGTKLGATGGDSYIAFALTE